MPELPEVESYARALDARYRGKLLSGIHFYRTRLRFPLDKKRLSHIFQNGSRLKCVYRLGKRLWIETSHGSIEVSLGMSGAFSPSSLTHPFLHEHLALLFQSGEVLGFIDPRRFGFWKVASRCENPMVDPLNTAALTLFFNSSPCRRSMRSVKSLLMDQHCIAGLGNIYAIEALHRAGLRPTRRCSRLKREEWQRLSHILPKLLQEAIASGGSTIATYRRLGGERGSFQSLHRVYDRDKRSCLKTSCTGIIKRIKQGGRSSWYCPKCQH